MKNLQLIVGLLSTVILYLYCVDSYTKPILDSLNSKTIKTNSYVKAVPKPIKSQTIEKSKDTLVPKKENELDVLTKKILEDMKTNKGNIWRW